MTQSDRMKAGAKEAENNGTNPQDPAQRLFGPEEDAEFAADSWMSGVMNPETTRPRGKKSNDPDTFTESYRGDAKRVDRTTRYEVASETAMPKRKAGTGMPRRDPDARDGDGMFMQSGSGWGWAGLGISILSLFLWPYFLGPIGIVLGYMAFRNDARTLGTWAMVIGAIAILGALLVIPFLMTR